MNKEKKSPGAAKAFGALLRFYREQAGISQEALGRKTGYSKSQVAMIERGERRAKGNFVQIADELLGAQGALLTVAKEVTASAVAAWFEDYLDEEAKAAGIYSYENHLIPGLLQTPEYARAVFGCASPPWEDDELNAMVAARMGRHEVFHRRPLPLIRFVLEKVVLTRPIGGTPCLKRNLLHILEVAQLRNVEIQVMPEDCETHAGLSGPFILLETAERNSQLVYVEGLSGRYFLTEQPELGDAFARYGTLRAQALSPKESYKLIEQVAREL
ncbi:MULTISPECIES: helix-turn-helix domain-containing protein [Streptomyces]|uniref:Transcriptional regulator with XRE-family HTH domain n=1 Tax=Streptomyces nymphaeiformis TaxID=2663842 RepID=A0A7W7XG56_9ACTN|nr:helix-turn-helix transcriptional regulator [Streptomyces nymphaeiformis]MBB4986131.1 transcriptional regulator with XRE-family HTH domain [Streptomyces nymphaeiformis]